MQAYGQSESIISTKNSIFPFHLNSGLSLLCVVQLTYLVIFDFGVHYRLWDGWHARNVVSEGSIDRPGPKSSSKERHG